MKEKSKENLAVLKALIEEIEAEKATILEIRVMSSPEYIRTMGGEQVFLSETVQVWLDLKRG
jgi:hypothetical protein